MSRNEIPLNALDRRELPTFAGAQEQQLTLQNMRRQGRVQDAQLAEQERKQKEAASIRQILSAQLPDDQTLIALRQAAPEAAMEYEKHLSERAKAQSEMSTAKLAQHAAESKAEAERYGALLQVPPDQREAYAAQAGIDGPLDDEHLKFRQHYAMTTAERAAEETAQRTAATAQAVEARAAQNDLKPTALGGAFVSEGQQMQPIVQKNAQGGFDVKTQNLGTVEAKPGSKANFQRETIVGPNGKPVFANYDPEAGEFYDPTTKQLIPNAVPYYKPTVEQGGGTKTLSPYSESNIVNRLQNQWNGQSKVASDLSRQIAIMDAGLTAARRGDMAAGSQAVLVTFQKILDPTSVVRESEYARSGAGQSLLNRISGAAEQLAKGGAGVTVSELEKFANLAREMAKGQTGHLKTVKDRIDSTAKRYGIPPEIITDTDLTEGAPPPAATAPAAPKLGEVRKGYAYIGGDPAKETSWKKQ